MPLCEVDEQELDDQGVIFDSHLVVGQAVIFQQTLGLLVPSYLVRLAGACTLARNCALHITQMKTHGLGLFGLGLHLGLLSSTRNCSALSRSRRRVLRMLWASWMSPRQVFMGTYDFVEWEGLRLPAPRQCGMSAETIRAGGCLPVNLSLLHDASLHQVAEVLVHYPCLRLNWLRHGRSIMAVVAMFCLWLRKYWAPSLPWASW